MGDSHHDNTGVIAPPALIYGSGMEYWAGWCSTPR